MTNEELVEAHAELRNELKALRKDITKLTESSGPGVTGEVLRLFDLYQERLTELHTAVFKGDPANPPHTARLSTLEMNVEKVDQKVEKVDRKVEQMDTKVDSMSEDVAAIREATGAGKSHVNVTAHGGSGGNATLHNGLSGSDVANVTTAGGNAVKAVAWTLGLLVVVGMLAWAAFSDGWTVGVGPVWTEPPKEGTP